jgi:hypothetical protein
MFKRLFALIPVALLAACGSGGDDHTPTAGNGGGNPGGGAGSGGAATPAALTVTTSIPSIPSDGSATAEIRAIVRDASNNLIPGVSVSFQASSGGVAGSPAVTDDSGAAVVTLSTAGDASLRTIRVTAATGSLSNSVNVQVVSGGNGNTSVQMGSGTGSGFQPGMLGISNTNLSAGGSASLQAVLQRSDGTLYTDSANITFSSPCAAQGLANIDSPVTTTTGIANATYAATGCSGSDVITATATVGGSALSASGTVTVAAGTIGSIVFESATPPQIALRGTGDSSRPEASTVVFRVLDSTGGPRAGAQVQFQLNTTVGGLILSPATAQSDATGRVQTVVQGGTTNTSVRVTATVLDTNPVISTQSNQLTVTTGIADQDSFSLAVLCPNVEAWNRDGVQVAVTARLSDRFNNPVPNGTAVTLTTEGGNIQSQCTTTTTSTESGVCTVNWTSSNPRPPGGPGQAGRSTLLATAIGEETFTDANGNGMFDNGEAFADTAERYRDDNEDGLYDVGEYIYDFNNNATRDAADGIFNGVLCNDTTGRCDTAARTTGIAASNLIIMSASTPGGVTPTSGTALGDLQRGNSRTYSFRFADLNDNPMPSGTTISASVVGSGLTLGQPSSFTVPCTTSPTTYSFTVTASGTATSGTLNVTVTSPARLETLLTYPIPVVP